MDPDAHDSSQFGLLASQAYREEEDRRWRLWLPPVLPEPTRPSRDCPPDFLEEGFLPLPGSAITALGGRRAVDSAKGRLHAVGWTGWMISHAYLLTRQSTSREAKDLRQRRQKLAVCYSELDSLGVPLSVLNSLAQFVQIPTRGNEVKRITPRSQLTWLRCWLRAHGLSTTDIALLELMNPFVRTKEQRTLQSSSAEMEERKAAFNAVRERVKKACRGCGSRSRARDTQ